MAQARDKGTLLIALTLLLCSFGAAEGQTAWRHGRSLTETSEPWVEPVSWKPRAFVFHNFLTAEECDHIIREAKPFVMRSTVVGNTGESVMDSIRTSYGTFLSRLQDPVITRVQARVAEWTKLNLTHQEDLQVLRYGLGQKYGSHFDSLDDDTPRVATVLLYLSDVKEGGETAFPEGSEWIDESVKQRMGPFSQCTNGGVAAKPRKGDALLFYSLKPDGKQDPTALHAGCPVLDGIKWTATIWIHTRPFRLKTLGELLNYSSWKPDDCEDYHPQCADWARSGECENNAQYMINGANSLGACRKSCNACEVCEPGDDDCRSRNRVRAGYLSLNELNADL